MHIHPLFVNNHEGWKAVARMFWRLCKNSDSKFRDTFDDDFDKFVKLIKTASRAGEEAVNKKLKWLDDLKGKKEKWAACYTWQHRTYGIHSTQRAEAIHSAIATFCLKTSTIEEIVRDLEQMGSEQHNKSEMDALDRMFGRAVGVPASRSPLHQKVVSDKLVQFPRQLMNVQVSQILCYSCEAIDGPDVPETERQYRICHMGTDEPEQIDDAEFSRASDYGILSAANDGPTSHVTTLFSCSCQYPECWGLPCRHMLCLLFENMEHSEEVMVSLTYFAIEYSILEMYSNTLLTKLSLLI